MIPEDINTPETREIIRDFLAEAYEMTASLDANLILLEDTSEDIELINHIFRAVHTVKGAAGIIGLETITTLTHAMEDVLNRLRKKQLPVTAMILDVLLEAIDVLKALIDGVAVNRSDEENIDDITARLQVLADKGAAAGEPESSLDDIRPAGSANDKSDRFIAAKTESVPSGREATIRVDVDRLDNLVNLMGELVLGRNTMLRIKDRLLGRRENVPTFDEISKAMGRVDYITGEIQLAVMKMRMQPLGRVFGRLPRLVRDLARQSGKKNKTPD